MKLARIPFLILTLAVLSLVACSNGQDPTGVDPAAQNVVLDLNHSVTGTDSQGVLINGYLVRFDGRTVDEAGTTFSYTVTNTGEEPDLTHFILEIPGCVDDPVSYYPEDGVCIHEDELTEIYGLDWQLCVSCGDEVGCHYSVTYPGVVPLGEVSSAVRTSCGSGVGVVPGPGCGYEISGRVFMDADQNGLLDSDESGISNVVVELLDATGNVQTMTTDETGAYAFQENQGDYTIRINTDGTLYPDSFNAQLGQTFDPTTPLMVEVTVGPDSPDHNFGFHPQTQELIYELETGEIQTTGLSVKYWKKTLKKALQMKGPTRDYGLETLIGYVDDIRGLFIEDPFAFADGVEGVQQAFEILKGHSKEPVDVLLRELLATELNQVSHQGLLHKLDLQLTLISWGESIVAREWASQAPADDAITPTGTKLGNLVDVVTLFELMNTGGGGSADE